MTRHEALDDDARDPVALAALGALPPDEAQAFNAHLELCSLCRDELAALRHVAAALSLAPAEATPPESLWLRLQDAMAAAPHEPPPGAGPSRLAAMNGARDAHQASTRGAVNGAVNGTPRDTDTQTWKRWSDDRTPDLAAHFAFVSAGAPWEPTAVAGIEARKLFVDAAHDRVTMLVRMAAGCAYPAHRHAGAEECYVLQGDLRGGDMRLRQGDYQRAEAGSTHPVQSTEGGCVLLLVSSLHDELLV